RSPRTPRLDVDTCASIPTLSRKVLPPALWIFLTALAVRLVHVWQMRASPFFSVLLGDSRGYDEWARRIAGGEWIGTDVFYQAPLYPYLLGVIYAVAGRHLLLVRVVQALIGSASCGLLALAAERFVSRRASVAAGLMLALYAPAIFFDGLIQKSVLDVFFLCVGLYLIAEITVRLLAVSDERSAKALVERPLRSRRADTRLKPSHHIESDNALTPDATGIETDRLKPDATAVKPHSRGRPRGRNVRLSAAPVRSIGAAARPGRSGQREGWLPDSRDRDHALVHASNGDRMLWLLWFALGLSMGALALTRENALVFI